MFVGVPQPKPLHRFSPNFQDMFVPRGSRADYVLGVSGGNCCHAMASRGFSVLLTTEVVSKIFSNLNVVCHLAVPAGWGSCLPRLTIF